MHKILQGTVVGTKMTKTVVVLVTGMKMMPRYLKRRRTSKKYNVANELSDVKIGSVVEITETRPYAKTKRWRVVRIIR